MIFRSCSRQCGYQERKANARTIPVAEGGLQASILTVSQGARLNGVSSATASGAISLAICSAATREVSRGRSSVRVRRIFRQGCWSLGFPRTTSLSCSDRDYSKFSKRSNLIQRPASRVVWLRGPTERGFVIPDWSGGGCDGEHHSRFYERSRRRAQVWG